MNEAGGGSINDASLSEQAQPAERLLATDHAALDELLRALCCALDERDVGAACARLDLFWARLALHIRAEHLHLFPAILNALAVAAKQHEQPTPARREARAHIAQLRSDHDFFMHELARAVNTMREVVGTPDSERALNVVRDVGRSIRALAERLAAHNRLEEEHVYRLPAILLSAPEQTALAARSRHELDNLPPRFRCGGTF